MFGGWWLIGMAFKVDYVLYIFFLRYIYDGGQICIHAVNFILKDDKHVVLERDMWRSCGNGHEEYGVCMHICPYIFNTIFVCVFELDVRVNSFCLFFSSVLFNELIFHVGTMFIYQK